ncbi:MAG: TPM domain-containing protein [Candidatus Goldbacteria bacterium]|nr:TPM domain-containing protein [Candidatus Goldiibacteriota bacterium]
MKLRLAAAAAVFLLFAPVIFSTDSVPYRKSRYLNDYASVINDKNAGEIMLLLKRFEKKTGIEASVLTIGNASDYAAGSEGVDFLAARALSEWKLQESGILLLVAVNDRRLKVELGRNLAESGEQKFQEIINNVILPYFKAGDYSAGIYNGAKAMTEAFSRQGGVKGPQLLVFSLIGGALFLFLLAGVSFIAGKNKERKQPAGVPENNGKKTYGGGAVGRW